MQRVLYALPVAVVAVSLMIDWRRAARLKRVGRGSIAVPRADAIVGRLARAQTQRHTSPTSAGARYAGSSLASRVLRRSLLRNACSRPRLAATSSSYQSLCLTPD